MTALFAAAMRAFVGSALVVMLGFALVIPAAIADSIEAERSYIDGRKDEAIRMFRRAAWQQNDFFAQLRLGDIYSARRADDKGYEDRVEAFVWYYLAARNPGVMEYLHIDDSANAVVESLGQAEREARKIYATLLQDERIDARNRIIYIQSCLGGVGFLRIGMYYDPGITERRETGTLMGGGISRPIVRGFGSHVTPPSLGAPPPPPRGGSAVASSGGAPKSGTGTGNAVPLGRWTGDFCRESSWWGWMFGDPNACMVDDPSTSSAAVFAPSAIEALVYYNLAHRLRHPYAHKYVEALKRNPDSMEDGPAADQIAKGKAKRWIGPFEYYASGSRERGETLSGLVHSDECPVNVERARALAIADRTISPAIRMDMLKFLNFHRGDGAAASVAVKKFQDFMGEEETGVLTGMQTVRLFQIAATRGYVRGQRCLGIMYLKGIGVVRDAVRAEKWLITAADQGDGEAMYALSELYSLGADGVEKLEDKANRYRQGAAIAGFTPVKAEFLRLLETAPVRAEEQVKPDDEANPDAASERESVPARQREVREDRVRPREKKRRKPQPRVRRAQPDDGPFGE